MTKLDGPEGPTGLPKIDIGFSNIPPPPPRIGLSPPCIGPVLPLGGPLLTGGPPLTGDPPPLGGGGLNIDKIWLCYLRSSSRAYSS